MNDTKMVTVRPPDTGAALCNPGMGWVFHYFDNSIKNYGSRLEPGDTVDDFPGLTVLYLRLAWSYLEPEEGKYYWDLIDVPINTWTKNGRTFALRITTSETGIPYATPEWVKAAGAKGHYFSFKTGITDKGGNWEPDFGDPVYLEKLENFLKVLAERYDGRSDMAFVDVGTIGVWGEGHTWASTRKDPDIEVQKKHIDLHVKHFKKSLLVINDDYAGPEDPGPVWPIIDYAREKGMTLRDDSILVQRPPKPYFHAAMAEPFWQNVPVVLESEHYGHSKRNKAWGDGSGYLQAVEEYHASYTSIHWWPREFLEENRDLIDRMNLRLGYRLQLTEASWPGQIKAGEELVFSYKLRNAGVAPCLPGGYPAITIKDQKGTILAAGVSKGFDVRSLPTGAPGQAAPSGGSISVKVPGDLAKGDYNVFFSVGNMEGAPQLALPLDGADGERRYQVGHVTIG